MFKYLKDNPTVVDIKEKSTLERTQELHFDDNRTILIKEVEYPASLTQYADYDYIFMFKYSLEYTIRNLYKAFAKDAFDSYDTFKNKIKNLDTEDCIVIDKNNSNAFIYSLIRT